MLYENKFMFYFCSTFDRIFQYNAVGANRLLVNTLLGDDILNTLA